MSGRKLVLGFAVFVALFAAALIWFQFFAYYERRDGLAELDAGDRQMPVSGYVGIDASSSPLKRRGCFRIDPAETAGLLPAGDATPLVAPFWFGCFDAGRLTDDLAAGAATAYRIVRDEPRGFDTMIAVYPDGEGYLWRQLNGDFE